jgi:S1-C subfamily serine protease
MTWRNLTLIACMGVILITLPTRVGKVSVSQLSQSKPTSTQISVKQLHSYAQTISVKVMSSSDVLGSGFILRKEGSVYTVLTNAHVLRSGRPTYRIQTVDGRIWNVETRDDKFLQGRDLALLQFRSTDTAYTTASLGSSPLEGADVFAAGFPLSEDESKEKGFVFTTGKVLLVLSKALEGGYQLGYTNNIQKGMSGGPLLDLQGQVVGVNGMHAYPLWDTPSVFADGTDAEPALHQKITRLSWAVPIDVVRSFAPRSQVSPGESKKLN